ncbi:MAG: serine hydrolase domain-containing protein [Gemmatimonadota bacterium]
MTVACAPSSPPRAIPNRPTTKGVAAPADAGMDPAALERVDRLLVEAIADSAAPGAALAIVRRGRIVRLRGYGRLDWEAGAAAVDGSTIYDLASLTKAVGATTALMLLVQDGRVKLDAPVARYLPWWQGAGKERVTVRQLLLHRGGLPAWRPLWQTASGRAAFRDSLAALELERAPGDSTVYSDLGFILLGLLVEEVSGTPLDELLEARVFEPLGMRDTGYRPAPELIARIAPTELDTIFRSTHVHGVAHDENAFALGGVAGHAGLFSSARDLAVFGQMLLDGGRANPCPAGARPCSAPRARPVTLLDPALVQAFTTPPPGSASAGRVLGWETPTPGSSAGDRLSRRAFGHTGFTGTSLWLDPELELVVVLLTNRVNPTRENRRHIPLRRALHDAVAAAVRDAPRRAASPPPLAGQVGPRGGGRRSPMLPAAVAASAWIARNHGRGPVRVPTEAQGGGDDLDGA